MASGSSFLIVFILAIALMILAIGKFHIHPFLAIMATSLTLGLICLPASKVVDVMLDGIAGSFRSIGLIVVMGSLIGLILEHTGAALKISDSIVRVVGMKRPDASLALLGWVASISVFCDSGFVILNPVRKAIVKRVGSSSVAATVALATGLFLSHCLIPPTPGPVAAAGALGIGDDLLPVMLFGAIASIPALCVACWYARFIGKRVKDKVEAKREKEEATLSYDELVASYGKLPNAFLSFLPIALPIVLMSAASICKMQNLSFALVEFLGTPTVAVSMGFVAALPALFYTSKGKDLYDLTNQSLQIAGPILFITAAGAALGKVVSASPLIPYLSEHAATLSSLGLLFPFLFAAVLKTAQGSSTVALTVTAGIVQPMLLQLGIDSPAKTALAVTAIGAGALTVSHVNDSYFWVVLNFGQLQKTIDGFKTHVVATFLVGITTILTVLLLAFFV